MLLLTGSTLVVGLSHLSMFRPHTCVRDSVVALQA